VSDPLAHTWNGKGASLKAKRRQGQERFSKYVLWKVVS